MSGDMKLIKKYRDCGEFCVISLIGSKIRSIYTKLYAESKWLFPLLTCLIVAGAVVLPPYISYIRDEQQLFRQIHTSELDAEALPAWEGWDLLERLELYARWSTAHISYREIITSFQTTQSAEDPAEMELAEQVLNQALDYLTQAGVFPAYLFEFPLEHINMNRVLLWDPSSINRQNAPEYWSATADFGNRHLWIIIDSESGLPLKLSLSDPNMAQWLSDPVTLPDMAARYFDLLGLKAQMSETILPSDTAPQEYGFAIEGTGIEYWFVFNATMLDIGFGLEGWYTPE